MPGVRVGRHARIRRAIIDRDVFIPRGAQIGYNEDEDRRRHTVSDGGVVVVTKEDEPFTGRSVMTPCGTRRSSIGGGRKIIRGSDGARRMNERKLPKPPKKYLRGVLRGFVLRCFVRVSGPLLGRLSKEQE